MKTALVTPHGGILEVFDGAPKRVTLPGVGSVDGATVGWTGGGEITYATDKKTGKEIATEGPPRFALVAVTEAEPAPEGQRVVSLQHKLDGDVVVETATYEEIPPVIEPTPLEKLERSGLTVNELKQLLGLGG